MSTARVVRAVSSGVPQWGATSGQSFSLRKTQGVPNVTLRSSWENSVNMPSVLANTSTEHSQEYTLLFQKRKNRDSAGPLGDTPQSHSTKVMLRAC